MVKVDIQVVFKKFAFHLWRQIREKHSLGLFEKSKRLPLFRSKKIIFITSVGGGLFLQGNKRERWGVKGLILGVSTFHLFVFWLGKWTGEEKRGRKAIFKILVWGLKWFEGGRGFFFSNFEQKGQNVKNILKYLNIATWS